MLVVQRVPLDEATARTEELGGRSIEQGKTHELDALSWRYMADPQGHEFWLYVASVSVEIPVLPKPR